jgi:hypothetical protein
MYEVYINAIGCLNIISVALKLESDSLSGTAFLVYRFRLMSDDSKKSESNFYE